METWLTLMLGHPILLLRNYTVLSQSPEQIPGRTKTIFPDLKITIILEGGKQQVIYCEHKWDSPCNHEQLKNYADLAAGERARGNESVIVFVGSNYGQVSSAQELIGEAIENAVYWADIYRKFNEIPNPSPVLKQFLYFMLTKNLGPSEPMNPEYLRILPHLREIMRQFSQFSNQLIQCQWDFLPEHYRRRKQINGNYFPCVTNRFGRTSVEFMTDRPYTPAISVGFLYDASDHLVEFSRPEHGIDLMIRFEADPKENPDCKMILELLAERRQKVLELEKQQGRTYPTLIRLRGETGNNNPWNLLIAQKCLVDVIKECNSGEEQFQAIYKYFKEVIATLFQNPKLEAALNTLNPYSGNETTRPGTPTGWPHN